MTSLYISTATIASALVPDLDRSLAPGKQSRFGTTGHPLSNLTRRLDTSVGNCQQSEALEVSRLRPRGSLTRLSLSLSQIMEDSPRDDISVQAELNSGQKRNRPERSNARVRASIACIPCRSKHTKCDGFLPSCTRCKEEGKRCEWPTSRRGIRDPTKRNMIKDEASTNDQDGMADSTPSPSLAGSDMPIHQPKLQPSHSQRHPLDLYYTNFHLTHSWLPPKETLKRIFEATPNDMRFLEAVIAYIASRYSSSMDSTLLWEQAYEMSHEPLPLTLWSVQALLSLSVASFGERDDSYRHLFSHACELALRLGLQHKAYADKEKDKVIAESCRRTYWGLVIHEMLLGMRNIHGHQSLCLTKSAERAELPCEEWEYQAGNIPAPVTLAEYDRLGPSCDHSSWAYFIDLIRIYDQFVAEFPCRWETSSDALEDANQSIDSWRYTLRRPKIDRVDENGVKDMILYHALVVSYGLQLQMQLHWRSKLDTAHPYIGMPTSWEIPRQPDLQAPLRLVSFLSDISAEKLSPSCIPYLEMVVKALAAQSDHRSKIVFLSNFLRKSGESWSKSRMLSETLENTFSGTGHSTSQTAQSRTMMATTDTAANNISLVNYWTNPSVIQLPVQVQWPGLDEQSVRDMSITSEIMPWPGLSSQGFSGDVITPVVDTTTGGAFPGLDVEADGIDEGSGKQSPHVKAEGQWQ